MNPWPEDDEVDAGEHEGGEDRRYASLAEAFQDRGTRPENQAFIREFLKNVDVAGFYRRGNYIKVTRHSGGPALQIHEGYTNGFRSAEDVIATAGDVDRWESRRVRHTWGITHPTHGSARGGDLQRQARREGGQCPTCGDVLPLSGVCNWCAA